MQIFTGNPCSDSRRIAKLKQYGVGVMLSVGPSARGIKSLVDASVPCAIDNGAFQAWRRGYPFIESLFWKLLVDSYMGGVSVQNTFIVVPDIVAGGEESFHFSVEWIRHKLQGSPRLAFAVQDGMTPKLFYAWHRKSISHIFVGGTIKWKWRTAKEWCDFAHEHGLKCHIGRVGTVDDLRRAKRIGADSVDGTYMMRNDDWSALEEFRTDPVQHELPIELES